jgi:hypothetical protein
MFSAPRLVFSLTDGADSRFHVLRSRAHFGQYRGRWAKFSCFTLPDYISTVQKASLPVFMFCAPVSFSAVPRARRSIFMFCVLGLIFGGTEGAGSYF